MEDRINISTGIAISIWVHDTAADQSDPRETEITGSLLFLY